MDESAVVDIARDMLWLIIKVSAPLLLVSLIVGLIVSVFQTVTSIQEQTLTFVPKLLAIFITLMLTGAWIMNNITEFTVQLCNSFSEFIR